MPTVSSDDPRSEGRRQDVREDGPASIAYARVTARPRRVAAEGGAAEGTEAAASGILVATMSRFGGEHDPGSSRASLVASCAAWRGGSGQRPAVDALPQAELPGVATMKPENRVEFATSKVAEAAGSRKAGDCR